MNTPQISEKSKQAGAAEPQAKATSAIQEGVREEEENADDAADNGKKEPAKQAGIVSLRQDMAELRAEFRQTMADLRDLKIALGASENRQLLRDILIMILVVLTAIFSYLVKGS